MRLKIKIPRSPLREPGKDGSCDEPAVIQLRFARVRIIKNYKAYKLWMVSWQISGERNHVLSMFVAASRINLLRGSGFPSNREPRHRCGSRRAGIADDASERITNFSGDFGRNNLTQHHW